MNSLLKFIQQYSNFLVFLILEVVAFMLLATNREYPKSVFLSTANRAVAKHYERVNEVGQYFSLREENARLYEENIRLQNELIAWRNYMEDSVEQTYLYAHLDYQLMPAKVVQVTTNRLHNTLTINKGLRDSVYRGMGVFNDEGVVGIVSTVGQRFSVIIPIIHTKSRISCMFAKNGYYGTIEWQGQDIRHVKVNDIPNHIAVNIGDTLVTSGLTPVFPANIPVAVVEKDTLMAGASYHQITASLLTDYKHLHYVYLIDNHAQVEQENLQREERN